MIHVYFYVLPTLADWEIGFVAAELNSRRFFKADAVDVAVKTVGVSKNAVKTMGGLTVIPDCEIGEMEISGDTVLILPGADRWGEEEHGAIIEKAAAVLCADGVVCAICGATVALANAGLLNERAHTSNGVGFLSHFARNYRGQKCYCEKRAVRDGNLITAGAAGALEWAKLIIEHLGVFRADTLEAWYAYFKTGNAADFFAIMQTLPKMQEEE